MGNYKFDNSETSTLAPGPHFDDERTLLSARPVVPLEKINARVKHRKHWFLGGAFALAMMLGAASALLASYLKLRNAEQGISQVDVAATLPVAEAVPSESPIVPVLEESAEVEAAEIVPVTRSKKEPAPKLKATEKDTASFTPEPESKKVSEEEELERIREAVLIDQWQERRARRVFRQERRRNRVDRYNHRDLSNLDEIFEGRRRRP